MSVSSLTILGGGNTAFAVAANLTLAGFRVTLCEIPSFRHTVEPLLGSRRIALDGVAYRDTAEIHAVTTDFAEALADNDLVLLIVPAYAHRPFAETCARICAVAKPWSSCRAHSAAWSSPASCASAAAECSSAGRTVW